MIGKLRRDGITIDAILARLNDLDVNISRSALGRHVEKLQVIGERMQRSRDISTALVDKFGPEPDNRTAQLNIELMQSIVMEVLTKENVDAETGESQQVVLDPEQVMFLSRAMKDMASAQKIDADRILKMRQEMAKEVDKAVSETAKQNGLSKDTVDALRIALRGKILGAGK